MNYFVSFNSQDLRIKADKSTPHGQGLCVEVLLHLRKKIRLKYEDRRYKHTERLTLETQK